MRIGCNTLVRDPDRPDAWIDVETVIELAIELGLDLVDVQLDRGFRTLDDTYLRTVRDRCCAGGIEIGYAGVGHGFVGVTQDASDRTVGAALSPRETDARIAEVERGIDAAVVLGAPMIRLFAGAIPTATPDRVAIREAAVRSFRRVATYAADRGIRIGLHNHPPAVAPTADDVLSLLSTIDLPNVALILDTGQWHGSPGTNLEGRSDPDTDFYADIARVAPYADYVRAKIYRIDSGSETWLDYPKIFRILRGAEYAGPVSVVYEDRNNACEWPDAFRKAVAYLRSFLSEP